MELEDIILKEYQQVNINKTLYHIECEFYGKEFVDSHPQLFDCIQQVEYHSVILDILHDFRKRRMNMKNEQIIEVIDMVSFTSGNADNTTEAVHGLDVFTKNWCMNCAETDNQNDLVFRCKECEFETEKGECLIKMFAYKHEHNYPLFDFGSMGEH